MKFNEWLNDNDEDSPVNGWDIASTIFAVAVVVLALIGAYSLLV